MARQPFRPVELDTDIRPVAAPVDRFVQPQTPSRDSNLMDLARSLQGLGGSLGETLGKRDRDAEENDRLQGELDFHKGNAQGIAQGVADGQIPAQWSKAYQEGYYKAQGAALGDTLQAKFQTAYDTWDQKGSTDPAAYDKFVGDFMKANIPENTNPYVLRGLVPSIRQIISNGQNAHIADGSKAIKQGLLDSSGSLNNRDMDSAVAGGVATGKQLDMDALGAGLEARRAEALKIGANAKDYDKALVDQVIQSSIEHPEQNILRFFERKVPGTDITWGETPYGREQLIKARDAIEAQQRKDVAEGERAKNKADKAVKDDVTRQTIDFLNQNPGTPVPEELLKAGSRVDPDFRVNVLKWKKTFEDQGNTSDPKAIRALTDEIITNPGGAKEAVQRAIASGARLSAADLRASFNLAEKVGKGDDGGLGKFLASEEYKQLQNTIRQRTMSNLDRTSAFDPGGMSDSGLQASQDFRLAAMEWFQQHPNATAMEKSKAMGDIGATILSRIGQQDGIGAPTYDKPKDDAPGSFGYKKPAGAQPEAPPAPPPAPPGPLSRTTDKPVAQPGVDLDGREQPTLPDAKPQPGGTPGTVPRADPVTWLNSLPPDRRARVEQRAKELGITPEQAAKQATDMLNRQQDRQPAPGKQTMRAPDGTPISTASTEGPATTGSIASDVRKQINSAIDYTTVRDSTRSYLEDTLNRGADPVLTTPRGPVTVGSNTAAAVVQSVNGQQTKGTVSLAGPDGKVLGTYSFVNGHESRGAGSIPSGTYTVTNYRTAEQRAAQGLSNLGDTFDLNDVYDPRAGRTRSALRIHQLHGEGTLGCLGIRGDAAWQDFSKKMQGAMAANGGKFTLVLGAPGEAQGGVPKGNYDEAPQDAETRQRSVELLAGAFQRALTSRIASAGGGGGGYGGYQLSTIKNDPDANRILDFVSGPESRGNYNAYFDHASSQIPLDRMSLDQVMAWSSSRGTKSSATGRYQFMKGTLQDLKKNMGLTGQEMFTPELQDKMAMALLKRRGYDDYKAGRITAERFANNLALEWASLPNQTAQNGREAGQSAYAGDGLNKHLVSPTQVMAAVTGRGAPAGGAQVATNSVAQQRKGLLAFIDRLLGRRQA